MTITMTRTASPIDQTRAALEAIDPTPHVERRDAMKANVARLEAALDEAQARLHDVHSRIRDQSKPDGEAVAFALLHGEDLPATSDELLREKEQLVAGIGVLNRQINDAHIPLRAPFADLKHEIGVAFTPVVDDAAVRIQAVILELETLYATVETLRWLGETWMSEEVRQICGHMLVAARGLPRSFEYQADIPIDPELVALRELEVLRVIRAPSAATVEPPRPIMFS